MVLIVAVILVGTGCGGGEGAAKTKLVVGTEPTFPPFESRDAGGAFVGFDIDLVNAIGKKMGLTVEFKDMGFDALIPALQSGQIDMIASGMSITDERKQVVDFSDPYIEAGLSLAVRSTETVIQSSADLKGKTAAVQQGSTGAAAAEKLKEQGVLSAIKQFPTVPLAMMELSKGGADVVINDRPTSEAYIAGAGKTLKLLPETLESDSYGLALRKGSDLTPQVNDAIKALKAEGFFDQLTAKYFAASSDSADPAAPPAAP